MNISYEDLKKELTDLKSKGQTTMTINSLIEHFSTIEKQREKDSKDNLTKRVESFANEIVKQNNNINQ